MSEALMTVTGLQTGHGDVVAVWDISLEARPGRVTALVGRNGAGKSTSLNAVAGLLPDDHVVRLGVTHIPAHDV